jgi:GDP-mannose 6-dehydrogenase
MRVAVFGLGYVGSVSAGCLSELGHTVIGVDVNPDKAAQIRAGRSPVLEKGLAELIAANVAAGRLTASADPSAAHDAEVFMICVGTPSNVHGAVSTSALEAVCGQLSHMIAAGGGFKTVVVRSTVLPDVVTRTILPALESAGLTAGVDFGFCVNPEFLREGSAVDDFFQAPFTLIGELNAQSGAMAAEVYTGLNAPVYRTSIPTASIVKYASNAYHAVKVAFANEIGSLADAFGADGTAIMDLFCRDTKLNVSAKYLRPGFAFGGSCLPKDLRALVHHARHADIEVPMLDSVFASNTYQIERAVDRIQQSGYRRIGLIGLSFKNGTDDLRESPLVTLAETLIGKGFDIRIYDPDVKLGHLIGTNRAYIEHTIPHIGGLMADSLRDVMTHADVVVIGKPIPELANWGEVDNMPELFLDIARTQVPLPTAAEKALVK